MTEDDLLELAKTAVPEPIRESGVVVRRPSDPKLEDFAIAEPEEDEALLRGLERLLKIKLPPDPLPTADSIDVAFHQEAEVGRRTTVVQIRDGIITRVIRQA